MTAAIVILFIISALMGTVLATLFYEVDFRANQLQNVNSKQIKTRDQILQMISNLDSQVKSLIGKVNEIETNLYMINEATDKADNLTQDLNDILSKLEESFPEPKEAITSQSIEEIAEKEPGDLDGAELYCPAEEIATDDTK